MSSYATAVRADSSRTDPRSQDSADVIRHLAHELRQPLSTIESIAYYLEMVLPRTDAKARVQVTKLKQLVEQANWILADAVHFLQAGAPRPELVDLNEIISEAISDCFGVERTRVNPELYEDLPLVRLDLEQARHMIRNLLMFFRQTALNCRTIEVCTWREDSRVHLEFGCAGAAPGIEIPESLFDPFAQHLPAGSGLALASARRIAEAHRGTIRVTSADQGWLALEVSFPSAD